MVPLFRGQQDQPDDLIRQSDAADLSAQCRIGVKNIDDTHVEISIIGKDKPVLKSIQRLPKGEILVIGGDAPNATSWLIIIKRLE